MNETEIREDRGVLGLAWAPGEHAFLILSAPFVYRSVSDVSLAHYRVWGLGDEEARFKWYYYRDRALAPRVLLSVGAGLRFPTAGWQRSPNGELLPLEAQPGTGSLDALIQLSGAFFAGAWSGYASAELSLPSVTRAQMQPGRSLLTTWRLQWQPWSFAAARSLLESRSDSKTREAGSLDPDSGGSVVFVGAEAAFSPLTDLTFALGARFPMLNLLSGHHREGPVVSAAATFDL